MVRVEDIERLVRDSAPATNDEPSWSCFVRGGTVHSLSSSTVQLLSAVVVPCGDGWFVPEELVHAHDGQVQGISRVPIVGWLLQGDGQQLRPLTLDPELVSEARPVGSPDGRIFLPDGSEFASTDEYLLHLRGDA
ncbi:MAG: hypothetical protein ACI8PT_003836 [Gammaproteobacteria bacterium]|jgi:hypothetical protein